VVLMSGQGQTGLDITSLLQVSPHYVRDVLPAAAEDLRGPKTSSEQQ